MLVLAAITAGMSRGNSPSFRNPIAIGAGVGFLATLLTWTVAVHILDDLSQSISALALQAVTGFLAVIVLLVVMNWFFHKLVLDLSWISFHNKRKRELLPEDAAGEQTSRGLVFSGAWVCWVLPHSTVRVLRSCSSCKVTG